MGLRSIGNLAARAMRGRFCGTLIVGGLVFLIVFTPAAFGTVEPWSITILQLVVLLMVVAWLLKMVMTARPRLEDTPLNIPALLLLIFILCQMVPLPPGLLRTVSPRTYDLYKAALTRYDAPGGAVSGQLSLEQDVESQRRGRHGSWRTLSVYPHGTLEELLKWVAYLGLFFVVVNVVRSREEVGRLAGVLVAVGIALAVFGIIQHFAWNGKIYWFRELRHGGSPFGPYVNRNHFAGYMEMVVPLSIGLVYATAYRLPSLPKDLRGLVGWLVDAKTNQLMLLMFAVGIMIAAVFLSLSRGGAVSLLLSLVFFSLVAGMRRGGRGRERQTVKRILIPVALLAVAFVVWMGFDQVWERLASLYRLECAEVDRRMIWRDTMNMVRDFPILGVGAGNFQHAYPRYQTVATEALVSHAHNDYLETISEHGVVGLVLLWGGVIALLVRVLRRLRERRDPMVRGIVAGSMAGIVAIMFHSIVDFNLHIPANAAAFFLLLALSYSCVSSSREEGRPTGYPAKTSSRSRRAGYVLALLAILLAVMVAFHVVNLYGAERCYVAARRLGTSTPEARYEQVLKLERATSIAPHNARYRSELAAGYMRLALAGDVGPGERRRLLERAAEDYRKAVCSMPSNAAYHLSLGWVALLRGGGVETAEEEFERALLLAPRNAQVEDFVRRWKAIFRPET